MLHLCHDSIVRTANELPALPQVVLRLSEILADPDFRFHDVVVAVQLEPVIASRLLRMANSPLYGTGRVTTIHEAAVRLGVDTVRSIALSDVARPSSALDLSAFGMTPTSYWHHSVATFSFAEELSARRVAQFGADFTTAALLHDFGKLILSKHLDIEHVTALAESDSSARAVDNEMRVLGVNHAEVTAVALQAWNLSERLVRIVQYHHDPESFGDLACHGLNLANQLAWKLENRVLDLEREAESRTASMDAVGITDTLFQKAFDQGTERFKTSLAVFGADVHS